VHLEVGHPGHPAPLPASWRTFTLDTVQLPDVISRIRPSILQIRVVDPEPGPDEDPIEWMKNRVDTPLGTGFLIGRKGFAVTAGHVATAAEGIINDRDGRPSLFAALALPDIDSPRLKVRASFDPVPCDVVAHDERHDLALLRLQTNPFESGRPSGISQLEDGGLAINPMYAESEISRRRPRDGDRIAISGYPLQNPALITTTGIIASAWSTDVGVRRNPLNPDVVLPDVADSYVADVAVNPGNSGGPVYFADWGDVIGVCVSFQVGRGQHQDADPFLYNSGLTMVVPVRYVVELLARADE